MSVKDPVQKFGIFRFPEGNRFDAPELRLGVEACRLVGLDPDHHGIGVKVAPPKGGDDFGNRFPSASNFSDSFAQTQHANTDGVYGADRRSRLRRDAGGPISSFVSPR